MRTEFESLERSLYNYAGIHGFPVSGTLELLPLCNMNCDMCYVRLDRREMEAKGGMRTLEEWLHLGRDMADAGVLFLLLTGGEPLLYPEFKKLYTEYQKMGIILTINTNGTLIDEEWADFFSEHRPRRINITLYGSDEIAYYNLCHYPGGFEKTIKGIKLLKERNVDVKLNGSLVKANRDDWKKIIEIAQKLDVPVRIETYMYPAERERGLPFAYQTRMEPEEAALMRAEVLNAEMGQEDFKKYIKKILEKVQRNIKAKKVSGQVSCRAGKSSFAINWKGEMMPCVILDNPRIPVFTIGFERAWEKIVTYINDLELSSKCGNCSMKSICDSCAASAFCETGNYQGTPEYLCRYAEASLKEFQSKLRQLE